ncbi:hypothetical protein E0H89_11475 [Acinetobacter sp. ANC 3781]|uniref:hypothetical protein n=1 Tax=Acinetobacter sp. ANC 3781 TaxID=2529835 RepID=UPI00103FE694|nr:hypothetical protein [Acinetobacter sp. ANC 3781]TCB75554.1 hypothetical protein E0H89_11475 [Acinetobacter sp. ANC 3781]
MNSQFQKQPDFKQQQGVQSFYEPALQILSEIQEQKKLSLLKKGYDENNAAVTKIEFSQLMARRFRITIYLADQIVSSLVKSNSVESFGGYVKPKVVGV